MTEELNIETLSETEAETESAKMKSNAPVSRYLAREQAFILCFERLFSACNIDETIENAEISREFYISDYAISVARGVEEKSEELDAAIAPLLSDKWDISRISKVSLCLLRIALYEILYVDTVPVGAAINEAVELAKKYSAEQDANFINGVLGSFARSLEKSEL